MKMKDHYTVVGRGKKSLLSGPGSELRLGREMEEETCEDHIWQG